MLKIHLLDYVVEDFELFAKLETLNALQVDRFGVHIEWTDRNTSLGKVHGMLEKVEVLDSTMEKDTNDKGKGS